MDEKNVSANESDALKNLCRRVEESAGIPADTPRHFEAIAEAVFMRTGILLSPTTLKRLWGYLNEPTTPRRSTLDTLARFCGWKNFAHFVSGNAPEIESGTVGTRVLRANSALKRGTRVRLMWPPSRVCVIEYHGNQKWCVAYSEGTRLLPGDKFTCALIVEGEPLYIDNLERQGRRVGVYVCARRSGVKFSVLSD
ncbi:MAG: hypothetical protein K2L05_00340 [Muribaculaceae bacterium]|nr:hypothetical protein [Muribaculaceae bacterium]